MTRAEQLAEERYPYKGDMQLYYAERNAFISGYNLALEQQWVSVEDGLPELNKPVLVFEEFYIMNELHHVIDRASFTGKYHENGSPQFAEDADEPGYYYPSHWQPLPQPPKQTP